MRLLTLTVLLIAPLFVSAAGDPQAGKAQYGVCAACHGMNGEGLVALNGPRLADQEDWYLRRQIENYKAGIRGTHAQDIYGQQMAPMAQTLVNDAAIDNVIAYIQSLSAALQAKSVVGDAERGKALYAICAACHGMQAEGNLALNSPRLTGQNDWYLVRQLQYYKAGIRGTHADDVYGQQMYPMALTLADDQAIRDVVAYINTLGAQ